MATVHGSRAKLFWSGYDLTAFSREAATEGTADVAETTVFGKLSKTYIPGLKDGTLSAAGIYDAAAGASAQVLEGLLGLQDAPVLLLPDGDVLGKRGSGLSVIDTQYSVQSPIDDVVSWAAEAQSSVGVEPVVSLHALTQETAGANGASVDNGASSPDGAVAYIEVSDVGTTLTGKVQHSVDDGVWVDLITFTAVTVDNQAERKTVAGTVNRYLRAIWTQTGNATFAIAAGRKPGN